MKILIDINKMYYEVLKHDVEVNHCDYVPIKLIASGRPLDEMFDKMISEIEHHRRKTESIDNYDLVGDCLDIINKYRRNEAE